MGWVNPAGALRDRIGTGGTSGDGGGLTPDPPGTDVLMVNTGGTITSDRMNINGATQTVLHGATIGSASTLTADDLVYLTLEDYDDPSIIAMRVWIDHDDPASLTVWDPDPVQGQPGFAHYDGQPPWTLIAYGGVSNVAPWDVRTDPTGAGDTSFDDDGTHRLDAQILRGDSANCDVPFAVFTISTTRSAAVPPGAPSSVGSTATAGGGTITWTAGSNAVSYEIGLTPSGGTESISTASGSPYTASSLTAGTAYTPRVRSVGADGSRSAWVTGPAFTPTTPPSTGNLPTNATGQTTSQAIRKRSTKQGGSAPWNATWHVPATVRLSNNSRKVPLAASHFTSGIDPALVTWGNGFGTQTSTFDGPWQCLLTVGLSYGSNSKYVNDNNLTSFTRMADAADGSIVAAINTGVANLFSSQKGGYPKGYWLGHTVIRLGWELGGQWNPVFPGVDLKLKSQLGPAPSGYSAEVQAAWNVARNTGDRFPMFKLAWDLFCATMDTKAEEMCDAAGISRVYPLICANLASGSADPGSSGNGPGTQWVPQCVTGVTRNPDIIGWDFYGRGSPKPTLTGAADGDPAHYDWAAVDVELDRTSDLCLATGLPLAMMEYGSCRYRDRSKTGTAWDDHYRAAFHAYVNNWLDTGCGGAGVGVWLVNHFGQNDCTAVELNGRISHNWSYTWAADTSECTPDPPDANSMAAAPLMRAEMSNWFDPTIIPN